MNILLYEQVHLNKKDPTVLQFMQQFKRVASEYLKHLSNTMKELNDKEGRNFCLDDRNKEDFLPVDIDKVVMRSANNRRHIVRFSRLLLSFKKVIAHGATYDTLPVLFQKYVTSTVNQEQTVNHDECCRNRNTRYQAAELITPTFPSHLCVRELLTESRLEFRSSLKVME